MRNKTVLRTSILLACIVFYWYKPAISQSSCPDPGSYTISCVAGNCNSAQGGCSYQVIFNSNFNGNNRYAYVSIRYQGTTIHTECLGPLSGSSSTYSVTVNNIDCNATSAQLGGTWTAYKNSRGNNPCNGNICAEGYCAAGICASGILPIELGSFTVRQVQNGAMVHWTTLSENNNDHFKIQRSNNALDWKTIGIQPGSILSESALQYEFFDPQPLPGINYYRLEQQDLDGSTTLSQIIELEYMTESDGIVLNLAERTLQILGEGSDLYELKIINMQGQRFIQEQVASGENTSIRSLPAGIYAVVLKHPEGYFSTHRFVIP